MLLFVMPAVFILIMTFALQDQYANDRQVKIDYLLLNQDDGVLSQQLVQHLGRGDNLRRLPSPGDEEQLRVMTAADESQFLVIINADFAKNLADGELVLHLDIAPGTRPVLVSLLKAQLKNLLGKLYLQQQLSGASTPESVMPELEMPEMIASRFLNGENDDSGVDRSKPSSVQQNVPGWLLFSMFFIAIPLSNTLISERQQGTLQRLHTMGFPYYTILFGKLIPYFFINILQVVVMLLIGMYLVPMLGGGRLMLGNSLPGLAVVAVSASLAAVSYSIFVAQIAKTTEQATILAGVCNIIMAAVGGIMVPRFIMPPAMQTLSELSPMAWGLDGFLDIFLRNAKLVDVLAECGALLSFSFVLLLLSITLFTRSGLRNN
ncbi:MAG: ABC transporter permease [Gammaproteobacteria bacterium]|nr:ABC transporter permease [Gammaproteobacteria bacterium]